jgi:hypothetical protein
MYIKDDKYYEKEIGMIKQELAKLPESHLTKRGSFFYETTGTIQKGVTKDQKKIKQLARKAYLIQRLKHLEWNYSFAEKFFGRFKTESPAEIIKVLPSFYRTLPVIYFFHPSVHDQIENTKVGNPSHIEGLVYLTSSGIRVRSKSERSIADALDQYEIPYHYEAALALDSEKRYPDFTIYRPSDGKMILWEHFGLMDQDRYRNKSIEKLSFYARHGFFPYDNLICTYEQDLLDPAYIQEIIEAHLLR